MRFAGTAARYTGFPFTQGQPILPNDYSELSFKGIPLPFFGLCLLIQMVLLFWLGKGVRGVVPAPFPWWWC